MTEVDVCIHREGESPLDQEKNAWTRDKGIKIGIS